MQSVLAKLNKVSGVRGCMIVNKDGIVAASDFGVDVDENSIGAVASCPALLLVLLQREANMGILNVEIQEAAAAVVEKAKM